MKGPGAVLHEIHRLHLHAGDLQSKIEQGPRQLRAQQANLAKQEAAAHQAHEEITKLKVKQRDLEGQLKVAQQQVEKYQKQLDTITSKKEFDAVKLEIAAAEKGVRKIEDSILEVMGHIEDKTAQLPDVDKLVAKAKSELAQVENDLQGRLERFTHERSDALKKLAEIEKLLPEELQIIYHRMMTAKGDDGLSPLGGRSCQTCYTEVTPQTYNELHRGHYAMCKVCGRILYFAE